MPTNSLFLIWMLCAPLVEAFCQWLSGSRRSESASWHRDAAGAVWLVGYVFVGYLLYGK